MKSGERNVNLLNLIAFIALIIFAFLQLLDVFAHFELLDGFLISLIDIVKSVCVGIVIGVCAFRFIKGKSKGVIWTYWISLVIFIICTILVLI